MRGFGAVALGDLMRFGGRQRPWPLAFGYGEAILLCSQTSRRIFYAMLANPIFTLALARPMVRTTSPISPF